MERMYQFAGTFLRIEGPENSFPEALRDFEVSLKYAEDSRESVNVKFTDSCVVSTDMQEMLRTDQLILLEEDGSIEIRFTIYKTIDFCRFDKKAGNAIVHVLRRDKVDSEECLGALRNICFYYLQRQGKLVIHSTSIIYNNKAWIFSAPGGTGKSTHVEMWHENGYECDDLNGDMIACYEESDGQLVVAGLPWCGTSNIRNNRISTLGGIFFLKRGSDNAICDMNGAEKMTQLVARALTPCWNRDCVERNITLADRIAEKTLVKKLVCLPNREAATLVKNYIDMHDSDWKL